MARAAAPKKCARPPHRESRRPETRSQASCTSAVACSVWPGPRVDIRRSSLKRGGAWQRVDPGEIALAVEAPELGDLLALDEALARLEEQDPLKARIVMLRFFAGLTMLEVAEVLGLPLVRIEREWRFARSWLQREVAGGTPDPGDAGP